MKKAFTLFIATLTAGAAPISADEDGHAELDAFMADAVSLLPTESILAAPVVANAQIAVPADKATYGEWGALMPWPFIPVTAANLPDGRIVTFASNRRTDFPVGPEFTYAGVWDPSTGQHTEINNTNHDMFCAAPSMGVDGKPIFPGGRNAVRSATVFDYENDQWVRVQDMNDGRWYAASTTMPNGSVFTASGSIGTGINTTERYTPGSGWTRLLGVPWDTISNKAFPHNFVAPDGRVFFAGPQGNMHWIDPTGNGVLTKTDAIFPGNRSEQSGGVAMYDVGKIIFAGGGVIGGGTTNVAHTVDINSPTPVVSTIAPMAFARRYHNALMLPDGKAIMIGGNTSGLAFRDDGTIYAPEMWDPVTDTWQELADMAKPRNYHSVALLLPDGRVYSGGGGLSGNAATNHQDAQIFSPPYLFNADGSAATRPVISSAPAISSPGATIAVQGSSNLARFTMVRMTATTHAFSSDVRFLNIPHSTTAPGVFNLALHANANALVPGYWMIFGLNSQGTPSLAKAIKISAPTPPEITSPGDQHTLLGHLVSVAINAGDGDGDTISFSASGLPSGLQIGPDNGVISGSPQSLGTHTVNITVTDGSTPVSITFQWEVSQDPGLISHWSFDETSGSIANDTGGANADGILTNGPGRIAGIQGGAISFNGVDEHVVVANKPALEVGKNGADFSLSFWIRLGQDAGNTYHSIAQKGNSGSQRTFAMWLVPGSRKVLFNVSTAASASEGGISTGQLPFQEWAHVAMIMQDGTLTLHLDGQPDKAVALQGSVISNNGPIYFGDTPFSQGINAAMDEIALYNRALSSSEIAFLSDPSNRVIGANSAPAITSPGNLVSSTAALTRQIVATDPNGDSLNFTSNGQLPPGLSLNPSTGLITGTPTTPGNYSPQITVSDGIESASITFQWQIIEPIIATPNVPGPIPTATATPFSITANGQNPVYVWEFGDASGIFTTTNSSISHSYATPGRYTVTATVTDDLGQSVQLSFHQSVHGTLTANAPKVSQSVIYETRSGDDRVWNVNPDNGTVSVFDAITHTKIAEIPVGENPRALAIAPDGQIWVTNKKSATISRISPSTLGVTSTVNLPRAAQPHGIVFSTSRAYVTLEATGRMIALNPATGSTTATVNVGPNPRHLSVNHDGSKVYVSRFITPTVTGEATATPTPAANEGGEVVVVTTGNMQVANTIILHNSTRPDATDRARGIPNYVGPAAISPDGTNAWVGSKQDNIQRGVGRDGNPLTHDNTVRSITSRINLLSETENPADRVDHDNAGIASTTLFDRYGTLVFSALEGSRHVTITDVFNKREIKRFNVQRAPQGLALSPDGRTLYVHNFMSRSVTAHDISAVVDGTSENVADIATYNSVASESLAPNVLLGKQHFYDAQDTRLALQEYISCAACHNDGAQDGRVWDLTGFGEGLRNTIDLRGRAGTGHGPLHWSANFDEVQDFEGQIRNLSGGGGLIANGNPHPSLGTPNAGRSADLDALADYVESLASFDNSPLRNGDGTLSAAATAGKALFASANCSSCHGGSSFTDSAPGIAHDIGTIRATSGNRLGGLLSGLDTPTLRGVASSAPYLHDGSAGTLDQAIAAHASAATLTPAEISQIASYLREIDGTEPAPPSPPSNDETTPDQNTIALYHFNSDCRDTSPHGLDLNATGGVVLTDANLGWMQSPSGKVARFTNIGDTLSVTIPDSLLLASSGTPITIDARIYARSYLGYGIDNFPIISLLQEWDTHLQLEASKWGSGPSFSANGGTLSNAQQWAAAVTPNAWHHLQVSFDGIESVTLWVDGTAINTVALAPNIGRSNAWTLTLGNFDGDLDELHITRSPANPAPDTTAPSVVLSTAGSNVSSSFTVAATFSENVSGVSLGDFTISNGSASALSGSGAAYTFSVSPNAQGTVGVTLPAAGAQDAAGNPNTASNTLAVTYNPPTGGGDETAPTAQTAALFHFNTNYGDASPNGINLTASGGTALTSTNLGWMQNPTGKVARFSNIGDTLSATIPDALILPSNGTPITIEARIYPRAYFGYGVENLPIISLHQDWDAHLQLEDSKWGSNPKGPEIFAAGAVLANAQQWATAATLNQWHLLQISYDGAGTVRSWLDGAALSAVNISLNADRNADWTLTLGNFDGDIDELHIHAIAAPPGAPPVGSLSAVAAAVGAYNLTHGSNISLPLDHDTDGDGWIDLFEVAHGTKASGYGAPDYHLRKVTVGAQSYSAYSIPVQNVGTATADGFRSAAFSYKVEASRNFETWSEPITVMANPAGLPAAPDGYKFITFRLQTSEQNRVFFRTTVTENP